MLSKNLLKSVLIEPFEEKLADRLCVVSGYATSAMVSNHFELLKESKKAKGLSTAVNIELIVGMCLQDGLKLANHRGFQKLVDEDFAGRFKCSYIDKRPAVHSKVYIWLNGDEPKKAFTGSANYSQNAFIRGQREILVECDPVLSYEYFQSLIPESIYCTHLDADNFIKTYSDKRSLAVAAENSIEINQDKQIEIDTENALGLPEVCVSFLDRNGDLPAVSGLNWGQDGKGNKRQASRSGNEAYIRLTSNIYNTDFFPEITEHFTILTDDNISLLCARAQDNGKAIHTPKSNSQIGEYFRRRLGVGSGEPVIKADLERYGRTDVCFYKLDEESYFMDFSV